MWLSWERGVFGFVAYLLHALPTWSGASFSFASLGRVWKRPKKEHLAPKKEKTPLPLWLQYLVEFGDSFEPEVYWLITRSTCSYLSAWKPEVFQDLTEGLALAIALPFGTLMMGERSMRLVLCCRGAPLLSEFGLVMDPVHSTGGIVWLVFWAFALFCLVVFSVLDFRCLNLFCTFFTEFSLSLLALWMLMNFFVWAANWDFVACTVCTFIHLLSFLGDCDFPVARAVKGKNMPLYSGRWPSPLVCLVLQMWATRAQTTAAWANKKANAKGGKMRGRLICFGCGI